MKKISLVLALAFTVFFAQAAAAAPLVANGGFETGDWTGWSRGGDTYWTAVDPISVYTPHSGGYSATFGAPVLTNMNVISQDVSTTLGQSYNVSFWLANDGTTPSTFLADWGTTNFRTLTNPGAFGWTEYTSTMTATSASTALTFSFYQDSGFFHLDDVSVTAVPIPGSLVLLASALLPLGWRRLRKS